MKELQERVIDVSQYQAIQDMSEMQQNGVIGQIARLGYRGYESANIKRDYRFDEHMWNAIDNNMRVGIYFVSQAVTVEEAVEEANYCIAAANQYGADLGIAFDSENGDAENATGRADAGKLSKEVRTEILNAFINRVTDAGYKGYLYCNKYWLQDEFNVDDITINCRYWIAGYTSSCPIIGRDIDYWQYTNSFLGKSLDCSEIYVNVCIQSYDTSVAAAQSQYLEVLDREGDAAGVEGWAKTRLTADELHDVFVDTEEGKRAFITKCYRCLFEREGSKAEVDALVAADELSSREKIAFLFMSSPEYSKRHPDFANYYTIYTPFLQSQYIELFEREVDTNGLLNWCCEMLKGMSAADVHCTLRDSEEGRKAFIKKCYNLLLHREASAEEIESWSEKELSRTEYASVFINSDEYASCH